MRQQLRRVSAVGTRWGFIRGLARRASAAGDLLALEPGVTTPVTMSRYQLRGTPSLIVIDRAGRIRVNAFGQADDMAVGAVLARLIDEPRPEPESD